MNERINEKKGIKIRKIQKKKKKDCRSGGFIEENSMCKKSE